MQTGNDAQGWILTGASSLACIIGSCFIFADVLVKCLWRQSPFDLKHDKRYLVGGLSLGAGVLLFTALNRILPKAQRMLKDVDRLGHGAQKKRAAAAIAIGAFLAGTALCILLNYLLHLITPDSIVHCGDEEHQHERQETTASRRDDADEQTALLHGGSSRQPQRLKHRSSTFLRRCHEAEASECAGFTEPCRHDKICCKTTPSMVDNETQLSNGHAHSHGGSAALSAGQASGSSHKADGHHHHITAERHTLLRIGLQTSVAISLHKLPEGFITFMSSHKDPQLGFSIFLALAIHNLVEGFTIAFPLFLALESRTKAFLWAFLLGGLSQPVGAAIGWAVARAQSQIDADDDLLDLAYGILFAATAGFMTVISISSMLPQAIRSAPNDGLLFSVAFFTGIALIGFSGALTG